jgi:hypothetical protein
MINLMEKNLSFNLQAITQKILHFLKILIAKMQFGKLKMLFEDFLLLGFIKLIF